MPLFPTQPLEIWGTDPSNPNVEIPESNKQLKGFDENEPALRQEINGELQLITSTIQGIRDSSALGSLGDLDGLPDGASGVYASGDTDTFGVVAGGGAPGAAVVANRVITDGLNVAASDANGVTVVWDRTNLGAAGSPVTLDPPFAGNPSPVVLLALNGQYLATAHRPGAAGDWYVSLYALTDLTTPIWTYGAGSVWDVAINALCVSPEGVYICGGLRTSDNANVALLDITNGSEVWVRTTTDSTAARAITLASSQVVVGTSTGAADGLFSFERTAGLPRWSATLSAGATIAFDGLCSDGRQLYALHDSSNVVDVFRLYVDRLAPNNANIAPSRSITGTLAIATHLDVDQDHIVTVESGGGEDLMCFYDKQTGDVACTTRVSLVGTPIRVSTDGDRAFASGTAVGATNVASVYKAPLPGVWRKVDPAAPRRAYWHLKFQPSR